MMCSKILIICLLSMPCLAFSLDFLDKEKPGDCSAFIKQECRTCGTVCRDIAHMGKKVFSDLSSNIFWKIISSCGCKRKYKRTGKEVGL